MDYPTRKGILVEASKSAMLEEDAEMVRRTECVKTLSDWSIAKGFLSRDTVKFVVGEDGSVRCKATRFIPANKQIIHAPVALDLSFTTLKREIVSLQEENNRWPGWTDLKARVRMFESAFRWHPFNFDQKDNFSKNVLLVVTIIGILKKLQDSKNIENESHVMRTFARYWHALPCKVGNVLFDWSEKELKMLKNSSFFNSLPDAKRFGVEIFQMIVVPFIAQYPQKFGATIDFETFMRINSIVTSRSLNHSRKACKLVPLVDLMDCRTNDQHNVVFESSAIQKEDNHGEFIKYHIVESVCDINAGDEIVLESPMQVGNGNFLLMYDTIPLDPEIIMNNQRTDVFLDFGEFLETELLRRHPNTPKVRNMKKKHIYGFFNLPRIIAVSMDELFSREYTCIPAIRQVLIFLQFNESDATKAIASSRIKSQFNPHQLFLLFAKFIELSLGNPDVSVFRRLLSENGASAESSEGRTGAAADDEQTAATTAAEEGAKKKKTTTSNSSSSSSSSSSCSSKKKKKDLKDASGGAPAVVAAAEKEDEKEDEKDGEKMTQASSASLPTAALDAGKKEKKKSNSSSTDGVGGKGMELTQSSTASASAIASTSAAMAAVKKASAADSPGGAYASKKLTNNMRSAIFLQMSERLVIEVMINRFIVLFPENFHELGYSVLNAHIVSTEINFVLEQLCRPLFTDRAATCMVCGSRGSISKCSRCRKAYYCGSACQKEHWAYHKRICGK